jgi:hypothetical protein
MIVGLGIVIIPCYIVAGAVAAVGTGVKKLGRGMVSLVAGAPTAKSIQEKAAKEAGFDPLVSLQAALALAVEKELMTEDEAKSRLESFASGDFGSNPNWPHVRTMAEKEGRTMLAFVKLSQLYPGATVEERQAASKELMSAGAAILDAAWIACGTGSPTDWDPDTKGLLPESVGEISIQHLIAGLELKFRKDRPALEESLKKLFPGNGPDTYAATVSKLKDALSPDEFQKGCRYLLHGQPEVPEGIVLEDLQAAATDRNALLKLREFLRQADISAPS